jgi:hypothetical protein
VSATGSFIASSGLRFLCPPQAKKSWVRAPYREEAFSCPVFAFCLEPHIRNFRRPSPFFAPRSRARRRSTHVVVSRSPCDGSTLGLFLAGIFVVSLPGTRLAPVPPTLLSWGRSPRTRVGPRPWKSARHRALPVAPFERDAARRTHPDDRKTPPLISDGYLWPRTLATNAEGRVPSAAKSAAKSDESKQAQGIDRVPSRARAR